MCLRIWWLVLVGFSFSKSARREENKALSPPRGSGGRDPGQRGRDPG